jgi:hypothetical protein
MFNGKIYDFLPEGTLSFCGLLEILCNGLLMAQI